MAKRLGIYIHIPFCASKCSYCDFYSLAGCEHLMPEYHKALLAGELPLTIGGGIGQSRLSMLLLGKVHIGEVQASIWDAETVEKCEKAGVVLL